MAVLPLNAFFAECRHLRILRDVPMRTLTTFQIGGPADAVLRTSDENEILFALRTAQKLEIPYAVMGSGSNILVRDKGIRGLVLAVSGKYPPVLQDGVTFTASAGMPLTVLACTALDRSMMGLEWAVGIPGTVGGACAMNAGAYGGDTAAVLHSLRFLQSGQIYEQSVTPGELSYRSSHYTAPDKVVLSAVFSLMPDDGGARERQACYTRRRRDKQPLTYPSAGSTFKRPEGHFAGALIENAGLMGRRIGGAQVSEKHAGFLINAGGASAEDVLRLMALVQEEVFKRFGVALEPEIKVWGEE